MQDPIDRRKALRTLPYWMVVGASTILLQCLNKNKKDTKQSSSDSEKETSETASESDETEKNTENDQSKNDSKNDNPNGTFQPTTPKCVANSNTVELEKVKIAEESFEPVIKIYGTEKSAMLVIALPKYQHSNLKDIYLLTGTGNLLAHKGLDELSDIDVDNTLKPILFDNIYIGANRYFTLLYQTIDNIYSKHAVKDPVHFETSFKGLNVYGLTPVSIPIQDYFKYHINNIVIPRSEQFDYLQDLDSQVFAGSETKFYPLTIDKDTYITDIMGKNLAVGENSFGDFSRHNIFVHYKLNKQFYLRTIVKIV